MSELPLNLLLLPLLGGFVFVSRWNPSRFVMLRAEGYRFLFHSALAGLSLLFLSALLASALPSIPSRFLIGRICQFVDWNWHAVAPVPYSGTAVMALILGSVLWSPLNFLALPRNHQIDDVISRKGDALEMLMRRAMGRGRPILVFMKNREVYSGYITSNFNPIFQTEYVRILPLERGSFKNTISDVHLDTKYGHRYIALKSSAEDWRAKLSPKHRHPDGKVLEQIERQINLGDFEVVLPMAEIQSVTIHDPGTIVKQSR